MAGVVIALFEKHDTPDDAMSAGYDAFGPALQQQIDTFLNTNAPMDSTGQLTSRSTPWSRASRMP